jgi:hypothetical protein
MLCSGRVQYLDAAIDRTSLDIWWRESNLKRGSIRFRVHDAKHGFAVCIREWKYIACPYPSFRICARVFGVQAVDYWRHGLEQRVIIGLQLSSTRHDGGKPRGLGDRDAAYVQVMN